jgi:protein involved in polysaccharide export with SLBB domain
MTKPIWHTRRSMLRILALGAGATALTACGTTDSTPIEVAERAEYRLGSGDELRITVFGEADLTGQFRVGSQGTIAYPLVGDVHAEGLTLGEFTNAIQQALLEYVRTPNVSVQVTNFRPFYILGEVQRPGTYQYSTDMTVLNAVATAGGFTYRANRRRVFIRRANETEELSYPLTIATPVLPGDTVRIGERLF